MGPITQTGVQYFVAIQTPQIKIDSVDAILKTPLSTTSTKEAEYLGNVATISRGRASGVVSHFNIQPVFDVFANVQSRDLGGVSQDIQEIVAEYNAKMKPGNQIFVRGLVESMDTAFLKLGIGFIGAIVLVYLLMVVNFQSWTDPLIIIMALPGAVAGIIWMLFLTTTTFNVPSMMGAIMSIGVATANSILMITFANEKLSEGMDAQHAALEAGKTRLRPVMMTAIAMIVGMIPMAHGSGRGRRTECAAGARCYWRLILRHPFYALFRACCLYIDSRQKKGSRNPLFLILEIAHVA